MNESVCRGGQINQEVTIHFKPANKSSLLLFLQSGLFCFLLYSQTVLEQSFTMMVNVGINI